jgi:hypothetical protein
MSDRAALQSLAANAALLFEAMRDNATDPANKHMLLDFVTTAKRVAGQLPPPVAPRFKVGDRVRVVGSSLEAPAPSACIGKAGVISSTFCNGDACVRFEERINESHLWAFAASDLTPAPPEPDGDELGEDAGKRDGVIETRLNETSAKLCESYAKPSPAEAPWFRMLAREIRVALVERDDLRAENATLRAERDAARTARLKTLTDAIEQRDEHIATLESKLAETPRALAVTREDVRRLRLKAERVQWDANAARFYYGLADRIEKALEGAGQ